MNEGRAGAPVTRIMLVDDHPVFREGLKRLLEANGCDVGAEADDFDEALEKLEMAAIDLLVTDMALGQKTGVDLIRAVKSRRPELPILVVSMHSDRQTVLDAIQAGAEGYLLKTASRAEVAFSIRQVLQGKSYLHPEITGLVLESVRTPRQEPSPQAQVTGRELQILKYLTIGLGPHEIGEKMSVSVATVKTHMRSLFRKFEVAHRTQLVLKAIQMGLVQRPPES